MTQAGGQYLLPLVELVEQVRIPGEGERDSGLKANSGSGGNANAFAVRYGEKAERVYEYALEIARQRRVVPKVLESLEAARLRPPPDFMQQMGRVVIAFQNAFYQLLHAENLAAGVIDTVRSGGDTDTTAAIAGALLGAVHGREAIPAQWVECILMCRPQHGMAGVYRPRPELYWPCDVPELARRLVGG